MAGRTRISSRIEFTGPFFAAKDPTKTIRQNLRDVLEDVAQESALDVRTALQVGEAGRRPVRAISKTARVSSRIRGRVQSLAGKPWARYAVVSPANTGLNAKEAIALYAAASVLETRTHAVRNAARRSRRFLRDLAKGLY